MEQRLINVERYIVLSASYQKLITGFAENTTTFQLLCKRNDIEVEESNLALIPVDTWICISSTRDVCFVGFSEQVFVPFSVDTVETRRMRQFWKTQI